MAMAVEMAEVAMEAETGVVVTAVARWGRQVVVAMAVRGRQ